MTLFARAILSFATCLTVSLMGLSMPAGTVLAADKQIQFRGVVPSHPGTGGIQNFPQTIVSFSENAALPIEALIGISTDVRVFDEAGNRITNSTTANLPVDGRTTIAQLVHVGSATTRTFIVCAGSCKNCLRYQVVRY